MQHAVEDGDEKLLFVTKVIVERSFGHADRVGDLTHGDAAIAAINEKTLCRDQDRVAAVRNLWV
jgi:hypothetical protein